MHIVNDKQRIEKIAEKGYEFEMEKYFSEGWQIFKDAPGQFILYAILVFAINFGLAFIPILGSLASFVITPALGAGYFVACRHLELHNRLEIADFFKSFDFILHLFLLGLVGGILTFVGFVFLVIPGIWFSVAIGLSSLMIVFAGMEFWDSITTSVKLVNKKWFHFFALFILLVFLNLLGAIALIIGLLITVPVSYCIVYSAYKNIVGFSDGEDDEPRDIEDHLVG